MAANPSAIERNFPRNQARRYFHYILDNSMTVL